MSKSKNLDIRTKEVQYERGKTKDSEVKRHPLALRIGKGPPFVPTGWKWRFGSRLCDYYYITPTGLTCRSKQSVSKFLGLQDGLLYENAPTLDDFLWPKDISAEVCERYLHPAPSPIFDSEAVPIVTMRGQKFTEEVTGNFPTQDSFGDFKQQPETPSFGNIHRNMSRTRSLMKNRSVHHHPTWAGKVIEDVEDTGSSS